VLLASFWFGGINPLTAFNFKGENFKIRPVAFVHSFKINVILPKHRALNALTDLFVKALIEEAERVKQHLYF